MRKITSAMVLVATVLAAGCGQKQETMRFQEALDKGLVEFKYTMVTGGVAGERDTEFARRVPADQIPSTLAFTPAENARVMIDRHVEGTTVRVELVHNGEHRCCEVLMDASRVHTGSGTNRGRSAFSWTQAELLRHVAPKMCEMLRAENPQPK